LKAAADHSVTIVTNHPPDSDSTLRHYLERQSYMKALVWLEDHEI